MLLLDSEPPLKYSAVFLNINTTQSDMGMEQFLTPLSLGIDYFFQDLCCAEVAALSPVGCVR